jgi:hypothetical protein
MGPQERVGRLSEDLARSEAAVDKARSEAEWQRLDAAARAQASSEGHVVLQAALDRELARVSDLTAELESARAVVRR